ncbi:MAG: hypothetical protein RL095_3388 [Verrucomicrobiota bacterium]|jgi:diadenosine tetraphosphatase ApaH/serine/threonine PP2A family protein phosphatase
MRSAIVTDIHANIQAWEAVLKDIDKMGCSQILCLGDVVGYGPNPAEVMESAYGRLNGCILGNHDAVIAGRLDKELFNDNAKMIIEWTQKQLSDDASAYFADMPLVMEGDDFLCAHAELATPGRFNYIYDSPDAVASFQAVTQPLMFVGHTHLPCYFELDQDSNLRKKPGQDFTITPGSRFLVNAGSVGDPRDGRVAASYVIYDHDLRKVIFRQVPFDIQGFRRNLLASGLPTTPFFLRVADGQMQETQTLKDMIVSDKAVKDNSRGVARIGSQGQQSGGRKLNFAASSTTSRYQAAKEQQEALAAASSKKGLYIGAGVVGVAALAIGGMMLSGGKPAVQPPAGATGAPAGASPATSSAPVAVQSLPSVLGLADGGKLLRRQIEMSQTRTKGSGVPVVIDLKAGTRDILVRELAKDAEKFSEPSGAGQITKLPDGLTFGADVRLVFWHDGSNYSSSPEIQLSQNGGKSAQLKLDDAEKKTHMGFFFALSELTEGVPLGLGSVSELDHERSTRKFPAYIAQFFEAKGGSDIQLKIQIPKEGLASPVLKLLMQSQLREVIDNRSGGALAQLREPISLYDRQLLVYDFDLSSLKPGTTSLTLKGRNKPRLVSACLGSRLPAAKSDWRFGEADIAVEGKAVRNGSSLSSDSGVCFRIEKYDLPPKGFTFDLVVRIDDCVSGSALFSLCSETNKQLVAGFRIGSDSRGVFLEAPGQKSAALPLRKGKWQRIVFSWDPAGRKAWLCSQGEAQSLQIDSIPNIPSGPLAIGAFRDSNQKSAPALKGALHRARILEAPLSPAQALALSKACPVDALLDSGLSYAEIQGVHPPDDLAPSFTLAASGGPEAQVVEGWAAVQPSGVASWKKQVEEIRSSLAAEAAAKAAALAEQERQARLKALQEQTVKLNAPLEALVDGRSDSALAALKSLPDSIPFRAECLKLVAEEKLAVHALMKTMSLGRPVTLSLNGDVKLEFKPFRYEPKTLTWTGKKMNGTKEVTTMDLPYSRLAPVEIEERLKKVKATQACKTLLLLRAGLASAAATEAAGNDFATTLLSFGPDAVVEKVIAQADFKLDETDANGQNVGKTHAETGEFILWMVAENVEGGSRILSVRDGMTPRFFLDHIEGRLVVVEGGAYRPFENKIASKSLIKVRYKSNQMILADLCGEGQASGASGLPDALKGNDLVLGRGFKIHQLLGLKVVPDEVTQKKIEAFLKKKWKLSP